MMQDKKSLADALKARHGKIMEIKIQISPKDEKDSDMAPESEDSEVTKNDMEGHDDMAQDADLIKKMAEGQAPMHNPAHADEAEDIALMKSMTQGMGEEDMQRKPKGLGDRARIMALKKKV